MTVYEEKRESYVYILFRPNGIPCYVGKGVGGRWNQHERRTHNPLLASIIQKAGGKLPKVKIREGLTDAEACATEIAFIAAIGRVANGGPLVNFTDGGDGLAGHEHSEATKQKMSAAAKGKKQSPEHIAKLSAVRKGRKPSEETRAKLSAAHKGRVTAPEHAAAISAAKKGVSQGPLSQAHKDAIGDAHRGRKRSDAELEACRLGRENMSEEARALKSARVSAALTGKKLSEAHRAKISAVQRGIKRSDEFRAKVSAGMKARRAAERAAREQLAQANEMNPCPLNQAPVTQLSLGI
jgi:hypothetical protein